MTKCIYAVRDTVADEIAGNLMCFPSDAPAVRTFVDAIKDPQSFLNKHPGDFELLKLGELTGIEVSGYVGGPVVVLTGQAVLDMEAK